MNKDTIKKKIDELYADNKSKGFLNHLIKTYLPVNKVVKVFEKPNEGRLVCVLTGQKLITVEEILAAVHSDEFKQSLNNDLKASIEGKIEPTAMTKAMNGKVLALTGEKTTTFISYLGAQALYEWVTDKIFAGDAHIKWLINSMRNESDPNKGKFQKKTQAEANGYRKPATTFGDLGILKDLKNQLEKEESSSR